MEGTDNLIYEEHDQVDDKVLEMKLQVRNIRLIKARKSLGFTQINFALLVGATCLRLSEIENLKCVPTLDEKEEMASALHQPVEYIFPDELDDLVASGIISERRKYLSIQQMDSLLRPQLDSGVVRFEHTHFLPESVNSVLENLTPREKIVIRARFGLDDGIPKTLDEVAESLNVSRERIRQIENKALRRLRHPSRSRKLKDYLE